MNLFEQFSKKMANLYFLVIMFMQMIDKISISNGQPAMLPPLVFVVVLSMIKDAYEDFKRHQSDKDENNATTEVYNTDRRQFETVKWSHVQVGDIVRVKEDSFFPADIVVLNSTAPEGIFYVETKNLDGETNLKLKNVQSSLIEPFVEETQFSRLSGTVLNVETPNNRIYQFDGNMTLGFSP